MFLHSANINHTKRNKKHLLQKIRVKVKKIFFGQNLKILLKQKNLRQSEFSKIFDVKQNTLSQWTTGTRNPHFEPLLKLAEYFDIDLETLVHIDLSHKEESSSDIQEADSMKTAIPPLSIEERFSLLEEKFKNLESAIKK